jgi:hypothetical protein
VNPKRGVAVVAGVLFITATVADVLSRVVFVQPILSAPDYLAKISASETRSSWERSSSSSGLLRLLGSPLRSTRS